MQQKEVGRACMQQPEGGQARALRQSASVCQEACGMARACLRQYAKSAQPRAWRSAWTMRAHTVRHQPAACRFSMLMGEGMAASRTCAHAPSHTPCVSAMTAVMGEICAAEQYSRAPYHTTCISGGNSLGPSLPGHSAGAACALPSHSINERNVGGG
jgi:hypothetical protein